MNASAIWSQIADSCSLKLDFCAINFDYAIRANHCAVGTADARTLIYHFQIVVTFVVYLF